MTLKEFGQALIKDGVEGDLIKTIFVSLCTSLAILSVLYFLKLKYQKAFPDKQVEIKTISFIEVVSVK